MTAKGPRLSVDRQKCELHGQCEFVAPELFRIEDDTLVYERDLDERLRDKAVRAMKVCPQLAIRIDES